jgi:hypothetical protein
MQFKVPLLPRSEGGQVLPSNTRMRFFVVVSQKILTPIVPQIRQTEWI